MKKHDVLEHFGGVVKTAQNLGITSQAVSMWSSVPLGRQFQIERITGGELKADRPNTTTAA